MRSNSYAELHSNAHKATEKEATQAFKIVCRGADAEVNTVSV
jgi:hypothetical protein